MSWSCSILGKNDVNLLKKYNINRQLLGLSSSYPDERRTPYSCSDLRSALSSIPFSEKYKDCAQLAVEKTKDLLRENLNSLRVIPHCETCTCYKEEFFETNSRWWSREEIERFLNMPTEEVFKVSCSW